MVSAVIPMGQKDRVYSGGQAQAVRRVMTIAGDSRIDELMMEFINEPIKSVGWEFRDKFIKVMQANLSTRSGNWFILQDSNQLVSDIKIQFLVDTVRFIFTGRRRLAITAWGDLLTNDNGRTTDVIKRRSVYETCKELGFVNSNDVEINRFIQHWLSQDKGFDDMVFTGYYLFGTKDKVIK